MCSYFSKVLKIKSNLLFNHKTTNEYSSKRQQFRWNEDSEANDFFIKSTSSDSFSVILTCLQQHEQFCSTSPNYANKSFKWLHWKFLTIILQLTKQRWRRDNERHVLKFSSLICSAFSVWNSTQFQLRMFTQTIISRRLHWNYLNATVVISNDEPQTSLQTRRNVSSRAALIMVTSFDVCACLPSLPSTNYILSMKIILSN